MSVSEERLAALKALAERPDSEIDFSDIPELDADLFERATVVRPDSAECKGPPAVDDHGSHVEKQPIPLTIDEEASFAESLAQAERGEFATDAEVSAVCAKHRSSGCAGP